MTSVASRREARALLLHAAAALLLLLLLACSPWIVMVRQWPAHPHWGDVAHLGLGLAVSALALGLAVSGVRRARWPLWLPLGAAGRARLAQDLGGLLRGRVPPSESGGLFSLFEGLLLLALLAAGLSGLAWMALQGTDLAMDVGDVHRGLAFTATALLAAHFAAVALHLRDFF